MDPAGGLSDDCPLDPGVRATYSDEALAAILGQFSIKPEFRSALLERLNRAASCYALLQNPEAHITDAQGKQEIKHRLLPTSQHLLRF